MCFDYQLIAGLLLLIVPAIAAFFVKLNMATVQGWLVSVDYAIAMAGTMSIVLLSRELSRHRIAPILEIRPCIFWLFISLHSNL